MAGGAVEFIPAIPGVPDLVFPANAAVVLDGKVLVARFLHRERQREEPLFRAAFRALQARGVVREVIELPPGVIQEGAGDCIWDAERGLFWAGFGQRSTFASLAAIENTFARPVVGLELATPISYHLDTCFCPLSGRQAALLSARLHPGCAGPGSAHVAPAGPDRGERRGRSFILCQCREYRKTHRDGETARIVAQETHRFGLSFARGGPFRLSSCRAAEPCCMTLRLDRTSRGEEVRMRAAE